MRFENISVQKMHKNDDLYYLTAEYGEEKVDYIVKSPKEPTLEEAEGYLELMFFWGDAHYKYEKEKMEVRSNGNQSK